MKLTTLISASLFLFFTPLCHAEEVDVFVSGGQSNANYNKKAFGVGIENIVTKSSAFSNAEVVKTARGGTPLIKWMDDDGNPQECYHQHFFNHSGKGNPGLLEARIREIKDRGDTVRFRGLFWFQGEADANGEAGVDDKGGSESKYKKRFELLLKQLAKDIGHADWNFVLNTVGNTRKAKSDGINAVLADIAQANPRGVLHNTQEGPQRTGGGVHSYNHILVGENNARLFIEAFMANADKPAKR